MEVNREDETPAKNDPKVERISDVELMVSRTVDAPARLVWDAWTKPELFRRWWVPKSFGLDLASCEMDVRVGGQYRLAFLHEGSTVEFFGTYLEVTRPSRLVWTNEEGDAGTMITTVCFREADGRTLLIVTNHYPSQEALEADGSMDAMPESLAQLDDLLRGLESSA